jgi:hypothetical protein
MTQEERDQVEADGDRREELQRQKLRYVRESRIMREYERGGR